MRVLLDFDDGWLSHYTKVMPLLLDCGFPATFFINIRCIEAHPFMMSWEQIVDLHSKGFMIGNHLVRHINMTKEGDHTLLAEIAGCERRLAAMGITKPKVLAYPGFHCSDRVKAIVAQAGYVLARAGLGREISERDYQRGGSGEDYRGDPLEINCRGVFGLDYGFDEFRKDVDGVRNTGVFVFHDLDTKKEKKDIHTTLDIFERCVGYLKDSRIEVIDYASMV